MHHQRNVRGRGRCWVMLAGINARGIPDDVSGKKHGLNKNARFDQGKEIERNPAEKNFVDRTGSRANGDRFVGRALAALRSLAVYATSVVTHASCSAASTLPTSYREFSNYLQCV